MCEWFDRWDGPGLGNDTELPLFCFSLVLGLVLTLVLVLAGRVQAVQEGVLRVLATGWRAALLAAIQSAHSLAVRAGSLHRIGAMQSPPESPPPLYSPLRI